MFFFTKKANGIRLSDWVQTWSEIERHFYWVLLFRQEQNGSRVPSVGHVESVENEKSHQHTRPTSYPEILNMLGSLVSYSKETGHSSQNVPTYEVITELVFRQDLFTEMKGILNSTNTSFSSKTTTLWFFYKKLDFEPGSVS